MLSTTDVGNVTQGQGVAEHQLCTVLPGILPSVCSGHATLALTETCVSDLQCTHVLPRLGRGVFFLQLPPPPALPPHFSLSLLAP